MHSRDATLNGKSQQALPCTAAYSGSGTNEIGASGARRAPGLLSPSMRKPSWDTLSLRLSVSVILAFID